MRWADITAFFTSSMWFGCNVAFAIVPAVMFGAVTDQVVDADKEQVGELFGHVATTWGLVSLIMLVVLTVCLLSGWIIRARRRQFGRTALVNLLVFAGVAVFTVLAALSYFDVEERRKDNEKHAELNTLSPEAISSFALAHNRSVRLSKTLTLLLLGQSLVLALALGRRPDGPAPASAVVPTA